uniref:Uncharacterized protein n=1 Tax=viral metagenome TaxID=1070528 RepID=A0A6C0LVV3_9ZZZZ
MASISEKKVYIEKYSEKSFIVRGDTRPHRESLSSLGGKWADRLTDKKTQEKFGAWLFWTAKRKELDNWVDSGCKEVKTGGYKAGGGGSGTQAQNNDTKRLIDMEKRLINIEKLLKEFITGEVDDDDEEDEEPKHRRLL